MSRFVVPVLCLCLLLIAACSRVPDPTASPFLPSAAASLPAPTATAPYTMPPARTATAVVSPVPSATPAATVAPIAWQDLRTFDDSVLGLSFQYPALLGQAQSAIGAGETGKAFGIGFTRLPFLRFNGISPDYSAGRGGMLADCQGYSYDPAAGSYDFKFVRDVKYRVVAPAQILSTRYAEQIVLLDQHSYVEGFLGGRFGSKQYAALVNLRGKTFPGMFVMDYDASVVPLDVFVALLESIVTYAPQ